MNAKLNLIFISAAYFLYALLVSKYLTITSIGLAFSLYIFLLFLFKIGKKFAINEMILLIASAQWIVGAKIGYNIGKVHYKYYMYVEEETYMNFVVPGVILFYIGLSLVKNQLELGNISTYMKTNKAAVLRNAKIIFMIGFASFVFSRSFRIPQISFILYLANSLMYIAVAYFMYIYPKYKFRIFLAALLFMLLLSLQSGFFHDLIILAGFLSFFLFNEQTTFFRKLSLISVGFIFLYTIQLVKGEYRSIIWESKGNVSVFSAFYTVLEKEFFPQPSFNTINIDSGKDEEEQANVNTRLNQGWIISKIMDNVPKNQPYLNGETIVEAIESSILPRFLFPNKKGAGQALVNFRRISGIDLNRGTSMGLSVIGEFYANYGVIGAWIAMLLYGLILAFIIKFIITVLGSGSPLILLWFLLFFFQVVKAETEFLKIINHLFKSILFFITIRFLLRMLNLELFPKEQELAHD